LASPCYVLIVISGGNSLMRGFNDRLLFEVNRLVDQTLPSLTKTLHVRFAYYHTNHIISIQYSNSSLFNPYITYLTHDMLQSHFLFLFVWLCLASKDDITKGSNIIGMDWWSIISRIINF
jgi:actin-related protein